MESRSGLSDSLSCDWTDIADETIQQAAEDDGVPADEPAQQVEGDEGRPVEGTPVEVDHLALLQGAGLSINDATCVCDALGATSVEDLSLVDDKMAREAASAANLKPVASKRLLIALEQAQNESASQHPPLVAVESGSAGSQPTVEATVEDYPRALDSRAREAVVICVDRSGSMGSPFEEMISWGDNARKTLQNRSRMDAVKQVFYAFRDRTDSLGAGAQHHLGLLQFDSEIHVLLQLTNQLSLFEASVDDMKHRGSTAIYSSIMVATSMLKPLCETSPKTTLRVLVLTDGRNNSGATPQQALRAANEIGVIVDAIIVGDSPDANLLKIVSATGGECYQIKTLSDGYELMEAEAVVSLAARRGGLPVSKPAALSDEEVEAVFTSSGRTAQVRSGNYGAACAQGAAPARVVSLIDFTAAKPKPTKKVRRSGSHQRITKELKALMDTSNTQGVDWYHLFPDPDNVYQMRVLLEGPPGTPFEGGNFVLNIVLPQDYPFKPPKMTFETQVFHCNISECGRICLNMLQDGWYPVFTISAVLEDIRSLLVEPETNDALRQWIAELTIAHRKHGDKDKRYVDSARKQTALHASKSVSEWKREW
eukprot:CAMPEP_0181302610 /NCGR_PEP_ID=MMETSP1101-20121128/8089_1 /TAXON_ID=46948 /ORGANISM="Rhodomonas abbreviata, Strain Caron Lab Isolate" /LENGTH=595 /DNA_ID=CAMNT_0023408073 /DNA_START=114 /DNA_END=1898 /DNA_ORIENTATION=+